MAIANKITQDEAQSRLEAWIKTRLPDAANVSVCQVELPQGAGLSAESVMFSASWDQDGKSEKHDFVARIAPEGEGLFMEYDLEMEFKVLTALNPTPVPTPRPFFIENDPSHLGSPFFVMERVSGRVAPDDPPFTVAGWVLELSEEQRSQMSDNALAALALLHSQDVEALGLSNVGHGDQSSVTVRRLLDYWRKFYSWALTEPQPIIEHALDWLDANLPDDVGPTVLSWGDARLGNMLVDSDMSVSAIIDWEMVATGPREIDLAWWIYLLKHHSKGVGAQLPSGFRDTDAEIARYEELTGHSVRNFKYFEVLAGMRLCILVARAATLLKIAGHIPEDSPMALINPASILLAELLDLPAPSGDSDYYIGNR